LRKPAGVDVVILSLNRATDTLECIQSVLDQDHQDVRLWVVDQGSQPDTVAALRERSEKDEFTIIETGLTGIPAGRNAGYRLGEASVIVALDNDAVFADTGVLRRTVELFQADEKLGALAFAIHDYQKGGPDLGSWGYPNPVDEWFNKRFLTARFCGAGHAVSRQAFEEVDGYDESLFFFGEELDLSWSMVNRGYHIQYNPAVAVRHKSSQEARIHWSSGRYYYNVRNMLYLNYKYFRRPLQYLIYAMGYLVKGLFSGLLSPALKGIRDSRKLLSDTTLAPPLGKEAQCYIIRYEFEPRGSLWRRTFHEVLARLVSAHSK
jgi:GT2 family glycosyltransferase